MGVSLPEEGRKQHLYLGGFTDTKLLFTQLQSLSTVPPNQQLRATQSHGLQAEGARKIGGEREKKKSAFVFRAALTDLRQPPGKTDFRVWRYCIKAASVTFGKTNIAQRLLPDSCSQTHQPLGQKRRPFGPQNQAFLE